MNFLPSTIAPGTESMVYATALADTPACDETGFEFLYAGDTAVCYPGDDETGVWYSPVLPTAIPKTHSVWYNLNGVIGVYRTP